MAKTVQTGKPIDFSIMPSFRCNLQCWFCMYDAGPDNDTELDYHKTAKFLYKVDWSLVNACGFHGGEPSIDAPLYDKFISLVPDQIPKFVITNGTWSKTNEKTFAFLNWCARHRFHVIVSSTPEHVKHQDRPFLEEFVRRTIKEDGGGIDLKKPDEIHDQGRAHGKPSVIRDCKLACRDQSRNIRLGLKPDGNIVFQNCHGEYHVVQTYEDEFAGIEKRARVIADRCYQAKVGFAP